MCRFGRDPSRRKGNSIGLEVLGSFNASCLCAVTEVPFGVVLAFFSHKARGMEKYSPD